MGKLIPFHQWLKQRRKALGLTQKELAQQAGCAEITLRKIEAGDLQPSPQLAAALAKAVGAADVDLAGIAGFEPRDSTTSTPARHWGIRQHPHNLPSQLAPLIGRTQDVAAVRKRLLADDTRLITLLGPPGVGKTRLAQAVAEDVLEQFEDGAFFVRLEPISDPSLVAPAIAQALNLPLSGPNPSALQLRTYLEEKHLLLVLDNFEQVIEAAPLVDELLRRCQSLRVLVTSRQPLRVRGERQMPVLPLALPAEMSEDTHPTANEVLRYPAVVLFAERAEAVQPDFAVSDGNAAAVAELCRRLDGLPLAIELVAARVRLLPPVELLARVRGPWLLSVNGLRDVSARQKTLRGAIGWSYDLLTPTEQTLFTRLAIFVGGCTLEAAEMICGDDATLSPPLPFFLSPTQVLDGIASLLDKSLLRRETSRHGAPRYVILETVREYGLECVTMTGQEAALRARHAGCILRLVENTEHTDLSPIRVQLRRLIDDEIYNVRTALAWAAEHDVQAALLLTAALVNWLGGRGPYAEGRLLIAKMLALPGASARTIARAKALFYAGILMLFSGEIDQAQAYEEESLAISWELGYGKGEADALLGLGRVAHTGWYDQDRAQHDLEKALAIYREIDDLRGIAYATILLSETALFQADFARARALAEECLAIARQAGYSNPWPLMILGNVASVEGDLDGARSVHDQALQILRRHGSKASIGHTLTELGSIATRQSDYTAAHAFLDEAGILWKELGRETDAYAQLLPMAALFQAEGDFTGAVWCYQESLAGAKQYRWLWSSCLLGLTALAVALDQHELAARLLGATEPAKKGNYCLLPFEQADYNRLTGVTRAHLGAERFDTAWTQGRVSPFEAAAEEAISILEAVLRA